MIGLDGILPKNLRVNSADVRTDVDVGESVVAKCLEITPSTSNIADVWPASSLWYDSNSGKLMLGSTEVGGGTGSTIDEEILYNDTGNVGGDTRLKFDKTTGTLSTYKLQVNYSNPALFSLYAIGGARLGDHTFTTGVFGSHNDSAIHSTNGACCMDARSYHGMGWQIAATDSTGHNFKWHTGSAMTDLMQLDQAGRLELYNDLGIVDNAGDGYNIRREAVNSGGYPYELTVGPEPISSETIDPVRCSVISKVPGTGNVKVSVLSGARADFLPDEIRTIANEGMISGVNSEYHTGFNCVQMTDLAHNTLVLGYNAYYSSVDTVATLKNGQSFAIESTATGDVNIMTGAYDYNATWALSPRITFPKEGSGTKINGNSYWAGRIYPTLNQSSDGGAGYRIVCYDTDSNHSSTYQTLCEPKTIASSTSGNLLRISNGVLFSDSSSRRYKQDIANAPDLSSAILQLQGITFRYKDDVKRLGDDAIPGTSFLAETAAAIDKRLASTETVGPDDEVPDDAMVIQTRSDGTRVIVGGIQLSAVVVGLVQLCQGLDSQIDTLTANQDRIMDDYTDLLARVSALENK